MPRFLSFARDLAKTFPEQQVKTWCVTEKLDKKKDTVVLISGFAAGRRKLSILRKRLLRDGYNVVVLSMDWEKSWDLVRGFYGMAEKLSRVVLQVHKNNGNHPMRVHILAYSAGGLVARYYIQDLGGYHYCNSLITLATPHQGTWLALLGLFTHLVLKAVCLFHLLPSSSFIRRLNKRRFPKTVGWASISSNDDLRCFRTAYADDATTYCIENISHTNFLLSKRVYEIVRQCITQCPRP